MPYGAIWQIACFSITGLIAQRRPRAKTDYGISLDNPAMPAWIRVLCANELRYGNLEIGACKGLKCRGEAVSQRN
jgi:hypothetical protein